LAIAEHRGDDEEMRTIAWTVAILLVLSAAAVGWTYSGQYNVAADAPHWDMTTRAMAAIREHSIAARAAGLTVPNLADPALIALGAEHYAGMCTGCHLAPGMGDNEMRQGLYPKPPNLTERRDRSPAESFWIVKHGLKMSGMPAWGVTHDDKAVWGLVAFVQHLPTMDAAAYAALTQAEGATIGTAADDSHAHVHPDGEGHDH
jgi:mono/diheme cytochrome c family protein